MGIKDRSQLLSDWEPVPWELAGPAADAQEAGFHQRALKVITWTKTPWQEFPAEGIFGHDRDWFVSNDIRFYATANGEDLILIQLVWHGFPDPPEWGLWSRPAGEAAPWKPWGHVCELPDPWVVPGEKGVAA
ncbi:MAG TPA: hypothetical protein VGM83_01960 [Devosiaceae bacterium]|jgi:hypothetical protein